MLCTISYLLLDILDIFSFKELSLPPVYTHRAANINLETKQNPLHRVGSGSESVFL